MGVMAPAFLWFLINSQKRVPVAEFFKMVFNPVYIFIVLLVGVVFFLAIGSFTLAVAATSYVIAALITIRIFGRLHFIRSFTFSLLGLSVYLYLPFRAIQKPIVNWWNPQTWNMLFGTVLRKGYQGMGENRSLITYTRNFNRFWLHAHHQYGDYFTYFILALSLWGVYWLFRKQSSSAIGFFFLGSIVFTSILVFNNPLEGYQWTLDNFFTPVFMVIAFFAAAGLAALCEAADKEWSALPLRAAGGGVCLGLGLLPLVLNYTAGDRHLKNGQPVYECNNQSRYVSSYDYGVNMLKTAKDNSVILCNGDIDILPLWYLQFVLGKRPSVTSFTMQLIPYDWYREPLFNRWPFLRVPLRLDAYGHPDIRPETVVQDMITQHAKDKSFYYTNIFTAQWLRDTKWLQEHPENMAIPEGFLWRIVNTKDMNYAFTSGLLNQYWSTYRLRYMEEPERGYWDEYTDVMKDSYGIGYDFTGYFAFQNNMADIALLCFSNALKYRQAQTLGRIHMMLGETYLKLKNPFAALNSFQELMKREPNATPFAYAKMGDAFLQMNDLPNAEQAFRNSLSINPQQPEAIQGMQALSQVQGKAAAGTKR
jgi:tetratricopeptide (TPR) repeat protein